MENRIFLNSSFGNNKEMILKNISINIKFKKLMKKFYNWWCGIYWS